MGVNRQTKQVKKLIQIFEESTTAIAVADLVKRVDKEMNKSTVYRALNKLMQDGVVHSFTGKDGLKWYTKCNNCSCEKHDDAHPHFQCKICNEVNCLPVSFNVPNVSGYKVESINLLLIGECRNCSQEEKSK